MSWSPWVTRRVDRRSELANDQVYRPRCTAPTITLRLQPTSHLAGQVRNRAGQPVSGQTVEVWSKGGFWLPPNPIGLKNGPMLTALDRAFWTPENLLVGSQHRVVIPA